MNERNQNEYDAILIGSGMGALAVASILAQFRGKRVLVLERHYVFGGFTHEFNRRDKATKAKYSWDVGIHYVGEMGPDSFLRRFFDAITRGGLEWAQMPDVFEKFVYPDFTFPVPSDEGRYREQLVAMFPEESAAIEQYFKDVRAVGSWFGRHNMSSPHPFVDRAKRVPELAGGLTPDITTKQYFDTNFRDEKLRALLASQWGDYGIPPAQSSFIIHCSVVLHYFGGGFYPVGGAGHIAEAVRPLIEEAGGTVLLSHEVEEILVEEGRAVGVRARNLTARGEDVAVQEFRAPLVISNAGAYLTYLKLLPQSVAIEFRDQLREFYQKQPVVSSVTLYVGLRDDPRKLGFHGENHWIFSSYDHDANFAAGQQWVLGESDIKGAYLSFPSLKNPKAESHTAEIIAITPGEPFERWNASTWKRRGEEYEKVKESIAKRLVAYIDQHYPGFAANIAFQELSTPLTVTHFTDHPRGSIYGVPCVRERFRSDLAPWCSTNTPVEGLYLTGADASSPGIAGALMGAAATLGQVPGGISLLRVIKEAGALTGKAREAEPAASG